ncbi:histidine kinase [Candidatus Marinamargulisbacteria bacterium SCGC AAA071-K20]|nr:histidine kinase [Candidatus Marinamargulisbacteria bacterium SCGC AAA071-K20]
MSNSPLEMKITIPCSTEFVSIIRLAISGIAARMNFTVEDIEDIKISVSEACTNAIQHAYGNNPSSDNEIFITARMHPEELEIEVEDKGTGFDLGILGTAPQKEASEKKMGLGLGITFIKNLMDHAEFSSKIDSGTVIRMFKKSPKPFQ